MKISKLFTDVITEDLEYEYKATLSQEKPIKWAKTIIAYANNGGGIIFVGVANDGEAFGLSLDEIDKAKNLVALINNRNIFPHVKMSFSMQSVDDLAEKFVLVIKVYPSDSIVRYKDGDFNETVFVKGDGNSTIATPEEIVSLGKRKYGVDNSLTDEVYDKTKWKEYISLCKEYRDDSKAPSIKELQNEEIIDANEHVKSGFLMFKDDYENDDSLICCRLWLGKDKTGDVLDRGRFKGSLPNVFTQALDFIERNSKTGYKKTENGGREEIRSYPKMAIREALVNAIAHRDYSIAGTQIDVDIYSDRIDITSPGSWLLPKPYDEYSVNEIPSIRRNTIIAACLDVANLMERGGTGFATIVDEYKNASSDKQPMVLAYPGYLILRIYDLLYEDQTVIEKMSDKEKVIELLKTGSKKIKDLQSISSYKSRSSFLREIIQPLIEDGTIIREGNSKSPTAVFKLNKH